VLAAEGSTGSCSANGSRRASLPNEMLIGCKRRVKTYAPQPFIGELLRAELGSARVCRLH